MALQNAKNTLINELIRIASYLLLVFPLIIIFVFLNDIIIGINYVKYNYSIKNIFIIGVILIIILFLLRNRVIFKIKKANYFKYIYYPLLTLLFIIFLFLIINIKTNEQNFITIYKFKDLRNNQFSLVTNSFSNSRADLDISNYIKINMLQFMIKNKFLRLAKIKIKNYPFNDSKLSNFNGIIKKISYGYELIIFGYFLETKNLTIIYPIFFRNYELITPLKYIEKTNYSDKNRENGDSSKSSLVTKITQCNTYFSDRSNITEWGIQNNQKIGQNKGGEYGEDYILKIKGKVGFVDYIDVLTLISINQIIHRNNKIYKSENYILESVMTKFIMNIFESDIFGSKKIEKSLVIKRLDRKSTRLNSSHTDISRMPSSA